MQKNLSNELLAEKFIIKTVTRAENTNKTRGFDAYIWQKTHVDEETKPMLTFGPGGKAVTVWQTTYSVKALHVGTVLDKLSRFKCSNETANDLFNTLAKAFKDIHQESWEDSSAPRPNPEPDTNAAILEELKKLNETIKVANLEKLKKLNETIKVANGHHADIEEALTKLAEGSDD